MAPIYIVKVTKPETVDAELLKLRTAMTIACLYSENVRTHNFADKLGVASGSIRIGPGESHKQIDH